MNIREILGRRSKLTDLEKKERRDAITKRYHERCTTISISKTDRERYNNLIPKNVVRTEFFTHMLKVYEQSGEASKAFRKKKQPVKTKRGLKKSLPRAVHDGAEQSVDLTPGITPIKEENADGGNKPRPVKIIKVTTDTGDIVSVPIYTNQLENARSVKLHGIVNEPGTSVTVDLTPGIMPIKEENADGGNKPRPVKIIKVTTDTGDIVSVPIYTKQLENARGVKLHEIVNESASFKTYKPANFPIPEEHTESCSDTEITDNSLDREIADSLLDREIAENLLDREIAENLLDTEIKTEPEDSVTEDIMQSNSGSKHIEKFIYIGEQWSRWNELKAALGIDIHDNMANYLLSLYDAVKYKVDECPKLVQDCLNRQSEPSQDTEGDKTSGDESSDESVLLNDDDKDSDWQPSDEDNGKSKKKDKLPKQEECSEEKKEDTEKGEQVQRFQRFSFLEDGTKRVRCNKCDAIMTKSTANAHWKLEHSIKTEVCPLCHHNTRNMYIHYRIYHVPIWRKEKEELLERSNQRALEEIHEKEKEKTICHLCGKSWEGILATTNVLKHIREVHSDKYSTCPIEGCGKILKAVMMATHVRGHRKEHLCTQCGHAFSAKSRLQEHVKVIHLQIRDHPCMWPGCKKTFKTKKTLTIHLRIHTDDKPLQCDKCEYSCRQRAAMNWHVQKHHGVILPNRSVNTSFKIGRPRKRKEISATQTLNENDSEISDDKATE